MEVSVRLPKLTVLVAGFVLADSNKHEALADHDDARIKAVQGKWTQIHSEQAGAVFPKYLDKNHTLEFKHRSYSFHYLLEGVHDRVFTSSGEFSLDTARIPKRIDFVQKQDGKQVRRLGIYV